MAGLGLHALLPNAIGKTIKIEIYETTVLNNLSI